MIAEDGGEALDRAVDREPDDRSDEAGDDRRRLEVVQVEDLGADEGASERRAEDGADAGADADGHGDARVVLAEGQGAREERGETGADLGGGALAPARAAGTDGDRRGDELDDRRLRADALGVAVHGGDGRVGPVPRGLRSEPIDDQPGDEAAEADDQRDRPGAREVARRRDPSLVRRRRRRVAADHARGGGGSPVPER